MAVCGYSSDMFVKITTSGPRQYVKLVESYRDTAGVPRQRVIATLGRIEAVRSGEADSLLNGLLRAAGKPSLEEGTGEVAFAPALSVSSQVSPTDSAGAKATSPVPSSREGLPAARNSPLSSESASPDRTASMRPRVAMTRWRGTPAGSR
jgi:hypothetical protein